MRPFQPSTIKRKKGKKGKKGKKRAKGKLKIN
jgi:hypothetical protein